MKPQNNDAVLGGNASPLTTAAVLGGQGKYLGRLFELFDKNAKRCNGAWLRWVVFDNGEADNRVAIALVRHHKKQWEDDLYVKCLHLHHAPTILPPINMWNHVGRLKHKGLLFGNEAEFFPIVPNPSIENWNCVIAYQALITKGQS
jgi:hypothetical protein